jgi:hypothetical protein
LAPGRKTGKMAAEFNRVIRGDKRGNHPQQRLFQNRCPQIMSRRRLGRRNRFFGHRLLGTASTEKTHAFTAAIAFSRTKSSVFGLALTVPALPEAITSTPAFRLPAPLLMVAIKTGRMKLLAAMKTLNLSLKCHLAPFPLTHKNGAEKGEV